MPASHEDVQRQLMSYHASFLGQHAKELLTSRQIVSGSPTISPVQNETGSWGGEREERRGKKGGGRKEKGRGGREEGRKEGERGRKEEERRGGEWRERRRVERGGEEGRGRGIHRMDLLAE